MSLIIITYIINNYINCDMYCIAVKDYYFIVVNFFPSMGSVQPWW